MAGAEAKTIFSVSKAIHLLDLITEKGQSCSLTELYQKTGWPKSTIHGLLSTMREAGVVEQTANGRYWLGIRLFEYGCAVANAWDIHAIAKPYMEQLCEELEDSVFLSMLDRGAAVTLAAENCRTGLHLVSEVGIRLPIHCTSEGKLFLANLSQAECRRLLANKELTPYTSNTLHRPEQFAAELAHIREQGYAIENEEYKLGLSSVSAPVRDASGSVRYALGCVGMYRSVASEEFQNAIRRICEAAEQMSRVIGYRR